MKKIAFLIVVMVTLGATTSFAYGVRESSHLTTGISLEMDDGTQILSLMVNDEEDHIIYFKGSDESKFVSMWVETNGETVYQDTIYNDENVMCGNITYICYCIDMGWL